MSLIAAIGKGSPAIEEDEPAPAPAEDTTSSADPSALITSIEAKLAELRAALGDMGA